MPQNTTGDISMDADIMLNGNMLEMLRPTSEVEVKETIINSPNKACDLDPAAHLAFDEMCGSTSTADNNHCQ